MGRIIPIFYTHGASFSARTTVEYSLGNYAIFGSLILHFFDANFNRNSVYNYFELLKDLPKKTEILNMYLYE